VIRASGGGAQAKTCRRRRASRLMGCAVPLMLLVNALTAAQARGEGDSGLTASAPSMTHSRTVSLQAQTLQLSLADAIALGLRGNRDIRRSYLQRVAHKFELQVAEAFFSPRLVLSGKHLARRGSEDREQDTRVAPTLTVSNEWGTQFSLSWTRQLNRAAQAGRRDQRGLSLEVIQPLLRNAGHEIVTAPRRRARLTEHSHRLRLQASVAQSVTQIVSAYRELLKAQEQQRIVAEALARSREQLKVNDALISAGRMARVDRLQNEADLAYQELNAEQAAHQLEASRRSLLQLLALDLSMPLYASEALIAEPVDIDRQEALQIALARQPEHLQQRIAEELTDIDLLLAKNQQRWDLSLIAGAGHDRHGFSSDTAQGRERRWNGYAGLQLEIPIGDLSLRQRVVNAQVAVETQILQQAEARQLLEREVSDAVRGMQTQWRQYEIALRSRELSRRKLTAEQHKLQVGRTSNFQVLSFEEDLRRSENAVLNALIAYLTAQTQLDERLGMTLDSWEIALND
jgi:outer membrane protein TolC